MERMFQNHEVRVSRTIEGTWDFTVVDEPEMSAQASQSFPYRMAVPSCWETHPDFSTYQGVGAYRTIVNIRREASVRLIFKGISHTAHIYWDGVKVAQHYNAYTAFDVVIPDVRPGEHTLIVAADNRFSEASALHIPNDYYTYGGIIRPVVSRQPFQRSIRLTYSKRLLHIRRYHPPSGP
ncbi:sugar-binding domain-containing protein [Paenibacillus cellulositrophicus]|uniref:sugar-binding domain-containing protein n=1 Tax=Paenibacillus cellulositrophicus TaxID=562959 RepID=UPI003D97CB68